MVNENLARMARVGDRVEIIAIDGFGGWAMVVEVRGCVGYARCKVRMTDGSQSEFWAHDFEIVSLTHSDSPEGASMRHHLACIAEVGDKVYVDTTSVTPATDHRIGWATVSEVNINSQAVRCLVDFDDGSSNGYPVFDHEITDLKHADGRFDSRIDTAKHIGIVRSFLGKILDSIVRRMDIHDQSKLVSPEVEAFDEWTPKLAGSTYGSPEYDGFRDAMKPALDHHYAHNDHHPEFWGLHICEQCGADDRIQQCTCGGPRRADFSKMNLVQITEMLCDWKAASLRHHDGDIRKSIEINQHRFGYSDELKQILLNTLPLIEAMDGGNKTDAD